MLDDYHNNDEISLEELFTLLRKGFLWAVLLATIVAILAFLFTTSRPTTYRASSKLLVTLPSNQLNNYGDVGVVTANAIDPSAYVVAAKSLPMLQDAIIDIASNADADEIQRQALNLRPRLKVDTIVERLSSVITLNVTNQNPQRAITEVDSITRSLVEWDRRRATRNISQIISALEEQITGIDQQLILLEEEYLKITSEALSSQRLYNITSNILSTTVDNRANTNGTIPSNTDDISTTNDGPTTIENLEILSLQQQYQSLHSLKQPALMN